MKKILKSTSMRDYCLFTLGINSGLRISDLLKLKINDVIDSNGKAKERISIREQKTNKTKDFPISEISAKAIMEYLKTRKYEINEPLFISKKKKSGLSSIQRDQAYKVINQVACDVGITDKIGTHTLRKTFGYHAYKSGIAIEVIQKIFNHSSSSITLRYIGITQDDLDNVYFGLNL